MKICVINGSPKGKYSVTLQTVLYLEKIYPQHTFEIINVGQEIKKFSSNSDEYIEKMAVADIILFSYPVYTFIAPSQLHQFIEIIKEKKVNFENKFVTQITTSKHFYDMTAHKYIEDNCHDLKMKVIKGLSLDMEDLITKEGQKSVIDFFEYVLKCYEQNIYEPSSVVIHNEIKYQSNVSETKEKSNKKIVIVTDLKDDDLVLQQMINDFIKEVPHQTKLVNIREFPFMGGCLGCFNCAGSGKCIYKDSFDEFLRHEIQTNDAIVVAFSIKDHSMGARFKMYDDRQFCNGHRTVTEGMPFAYIINGDYESEHNLKTIVEARAEVGHNFLAGVGYNSETLKQMVKKLDYAIVNQYVQPRNFYGVGGMKIFRDLIWVMRGIMRADHLYYKKHGVYDFPQKQRGKMILMSILGSMVRNPKIKKKMGNKFNEGMLAPYQKVLKKLDKRK